MSIGYMRISGTDISRLVNKLEDIVEGEQTAQVSVACIVVAITAQMPDIGPEQLQSAVKGVSEWLAAYLAPTSEVTH